MTTLKVIMLLPSCSSLRSSLPIVAISFVADLRNIDSLASRVIRIHTLVSRLLHVVRLSISTSSSTLNRTVPSPPCVTRTPSVTGSEESGCRGVEMTRADGDTCAVTTINVDTPTTATDSVTSIEMVATSNSPLYSDIPADAVLSTTTEVVTPDEATTNSPLYSDVPTDAVTSTDTVVVTSVGAVVVPVMHTDANEVTTGDAVREGTEVVTSIVKGVLAVVGAVGAVTHVDQEAVIHVDQEAVARVDPEAVARVDLAVTRVDQEAVTRVDQEAVTRVDPETVIRVDQEAVTTVDVVTTDTEVVISTDEVVTKSVNTTSDSVTTPDASTITNNVKSNYTSPLIKHTTTVTDTRTAILTRCMTPTQDSSSSFCNLVRDCVNSSSRSVALCEEGVGGTYFIKDRSGRNRAVFKPIDEEPGAMNNPKVALNRLLLPPGGGATREVVAYLLDRHHAGVPETCTIEGLIHKNFFFADRVIVPKSGSIQKFVDNIGSAADFGASLFPIKDVHNIGILDIRLLNIDRNDENILVVHQPHPHNPSSSLSHSSPTTTSSYSTSSLSLKPIDHTYILPHSMVDIDIYFVWLTWKQTQQPFSEENLKYIQQIDIQQDVQILRNMCISEQSIFNSVVSTLILKKGAQYQFNLYQIAKFICTTKRNTTNSTSYLSCLQEIIADCVKRGVVVFGRGGCVGGDECEAGVNSGSDRGGYDVFYDFDQLEELVEEFIKRKFKILSESN